MNKILVTTSRGLDELLKQEILTLCPGVEISLTPGMLSFEGTLEQAYTLCLWSRLANRVILCLSRTEGVETPDALHDAAAAVDCSKGSTVAFSFRVQRQLYFEYRVYRAMF